MYTSLQPNTRYKISWIVDGDSGVTTYYVDENRTVERATGLRELNGIRFGNYGYGQADLRYTLNDIRVLSAWPSYHVASQLQEPVSVFAIGISGGAQLAWTPHPNAGRVRIVRSQLDYPASPSDGTLVYEGTGRDFRDNVSAGTYFYSFFSAPTSSALSFSSAKCSKSATTR